MQNYKEHKQLGKQTIKRTNKFLVTNPKEMEMCELLDDSK